MAPIHPTISSPKSIQTLHIHVFELLQAYNPQPQSPRRVDTPRIPNKRDYHPIDGQQLSAAQCKEKKPIVRYRQSQISQ